MVASLTN